MADEILYAGVADQRTAETLSAEFLFLNAARDALPNHPALFYAGDAKGTGSVAIKVPSVGLMGYDLPTAMAEGASVANTPLADHSATVTVVRHSQSYEAGDIARLSDSKGILTPALFAANAIQARASLLVSLVANVADDFTATAGSTGVDMTIANFLTASNLLEVSNVPPAYLSILHPTQWGDLKTALTTTSGGAIQWLPATAEQIQLLGTGFKGRYLGVDVFTSTLVPSKNAGADRGGSMFGRGAVLWADSSVDTAGNPALIAIGGKILFGLDRTERAALTAFIAHHFLGASIGRNENGVSIITDL